MTHRTYRVALTGSITVDDATVRSGLLGVRWYAQPGDPPISDEERFEIDEHFLTFTETLPPADRLHAFLVNRPLAEVREPLARGLEGWLPGARVTVEGVRVEDVVPAEAGETGGSPAP